MQKIFRVHAMGGPLFGSFASHPRDALLSYQPEPWDSWNNPLIRILKGTALGIGTPPDVITTFHPWTRDINR